MYFLMEELFVVKLSKEEAAQKKKAPYSTNTIYTYLKERNSEKAYVINTFRTSWSVNKTMIFACG